MNRSRSCPADGKLDPKPLRVLVCGGRDYTNYAAVARALDAVRAESPIDCIIHGNARGADTCAANWAYGRRDLGVRCFAVPAQWAKYGKRAGPIRNQQMLGMGVDLVVAFPGGDGTRDMVRRARAAGVKVHEPFPPPPEAKP